MVYNNWTHQFIGWMSTIKDRVGLSKDGKNGHEVFIIDQNMKGEKST